MGLLAMLAILASLAGCEPAQTRIDHRQEIAFTDLPSEAQATITLIRHGAQLPYAKDGSVFFNRERLLPPAERGYYREYTVRTPGVRGRGARRLVGGQAGEFYYTADHYQSFRRVRE